MANNEKSKNYWNGVNDANKKKSNPPSKGLNWKPAAVIGGLLAGPVGAIAGAIFGDSNKKTSQKKSNNGAYKAGNKKK
jgi:hypothetical protein